MTTKFSSKAFRETEFATIRSKIERKIIVGLEPGDLISFRLKKEKRTIYIPVSTAFRYALSLQVRAEKAAKAVAKKARKS